MRVACLFFASSLLLIKVNAQSNNPTSLSAFGEKDSTTITGFIKPYDPIGDDKMINFLVKDLRGRQQQYATLINPDGSFRYRILQFYKGDFGVIHKKMYVSIYGEPGEQIELIIHNDKVDSTMNLPAIFEVKGRSASISNGILIYIKEQYIDRFEELRPKLEERNMPDEAFALYTQTLWQKNMDALRKFLKIHNLENNVVLQNWLSNHITYNAARNIISHPFQGKINRTITVPAMKALLGSIPLYQNAALQCSAYYAFLQSFSGNIQICVLNNNTTYDSASTVYGKNRIPVYLDEADHLQLSKQIREIIYYNIYEDLTENKKFVADALKFQERFDQNIQDPFLKKRIDQMRNSLINETRSVNILEKIRAYKTTASAKQNLISIIENATKDKYAFIDFWGTWCGPCMAEMPYYAAFIDTFCNKPINFLFLSYKTTADAAKQTKENNMIHATFINLTDDEAGVLNEVFEFTAYPSHFVLAPGGMLLGKYDQTISYSSDKKTKIFNTAMLFSMIK